MDRKPINARRKVLYDAEGNRYVAEHAGAWDPPEGDEERIYEDDRIPAGAVSLYRLTKVKERVAIVRV